MAQSETEVAQPATGGLATPGLLERLRPQPEDALLALIGAFRNDPRPDKIDVGVGVYRDADGATPVMRAVKAAERTLLNTQDSKGYLGPEGDVQFFALLKAVLFGSGFDEARIGGFQTPGGTGALRLAADLIAKARPQARIFVGNPTWINHPPIFSAAGIEMVGYSGFEVAGQTLRFDHLVDVVTNRAQPGDVLLLHGCCHNPTGADLEIGQWRTLAGLLRERGVMPLIDLAYQGLGDGIDADAAGTRIVAETVDEALIAYSCDKNFGLYRERTGALFSVSPDAERRAVIQSNLLAIARANWSMPPDHGAAIVRTILEDPDLSLDWRAELEAMRLRIVGIREMLVRDDPGLAPLADQNGMFATLPLDAAQVRRLRDEFAIYMPVSGRINLAGLNDASAPRFVSALRHVR